MAEKTSVLVVDDDVSFAEGLADILTEKGYSTVAVNSGKEALEKIKGIPFDIVLMDIKMPVMDGLQTFKEIKKLRPSIKVVMMTAYAVDDLIKDALKEGAYGVMSKPLDIEELIKRIEISKINGSLTMIVDDDPSICMSLKDILEEKGYVVATARDGQDAIAVIKKRPIDIVVLDMNLPFLNGMETFLELKKVNPAINAIIITGYKEDMKDLVERTLTNGAYCCIYKPFDPKKIVEIVGEIAGKKKKEV